MITRKINRGGFTLLEVLMASTIALLLLAALYVSFDVVINQTDAGREEVDKNDLARAVVSRLTIDCVGVCGPLPPKSGGSAQAATAAAAATGQTDPSTADPATGTGGTGTDTGSTSTDTTADPTVTAATTGGDIPFGAGLIGTNNTMTLFVSRVPLALVNREFAANGNQQSDLRRVTYYRGANGGLCRQERALVTADGVWNSADADRTDEAGDLVAEEITEVLFQYFDGPSMSWVDSWDGTQLATDGKSLIGPPRGIKITLTIERPGTPVRRFSHVIALQSASGNTIVEAPADDSTTTGGTTP